MIIEEIIEIINEPIHGIEFYNRKTFKKLIEELYEFEKKYTYIKDFSEKEKINEINNYIKSIIKIRKEYFDVLNKKTSKFNKEELIYRTAYSALVEKESVCVGYIEAVRLLLSVFGIKSYTVLCKLPEKNKKFMHYIAVAEYHNDKGILKYQLLDPERQKNCEKKGYDFSKYLNQMLFTIPTEMYIKDIVGKDGVGLEAEQFLRDSSTPIIKGVENIGKLIDIKKQKEEKEKNRKDR